MCEDDTTATDRSERFAKHRKECIVSDKQHVLHVICACTCQLKGRVITIDRYRYRRTPLGRNGVVQTTPFDTTNRCSKIGHRINCVSSPTMLKMREEPGRHHYLTRPIGAAKRCERSEQMVPRLCCVTTKTTNKNVAVSNKYRCYYCCYCCYHQASTLQNIFIQRFMFLSGSKEKATNNRFPHPSKLR